MWLQGPAPCTVLSFPSHPRAGEELGTQAKQLRVGISCSLVPNFRELPGLFDPFPSSEASAASPSFWSQLVICGSHSSKLRSCPQEPSAGGGGRGSFKPAPAHPGSASAQQPPSSSSIRPRCGAFGELLGLNGHPLLSSSLCCSPGSGPGAAPSPHPRAPRVAPGGGAYLGLVAGV